MYFRNAGSSRIMAPCSRQMRWNSSTSRSGRRFTSTVSLIIWPDPFSKALEVVAAVHAQRLAGDALGEVAGGEHDRAGDLRRVGQVAEARLRLELRQLLVVGDALLLCHVADVPLDLVAPDVAGVDGVDPDAVRAEL